MAYKIPKVKIIKREQKAYVLVPIKSFADTKEIIALTPTEFNKASRRIRIWKKKKSPIYLFDL